MACRPSSRRSRCAGARAAPPRTSAGSARLLRDLQPDVVHAHWLCGFACFAALAGAKPLVAMAWGSDVLRADRLKRAANRLALNRAALAMADSQALLEAMVDLGGRRERMQLMSWGVDLDHFRPRERARKDVRAELGLPEGRVILSPRSLMPLYNPRTIVDAFELLADELPDIQLVLKHMSTDRPPVGPLRHPDRVHIVGHVPYERMVDWYQASDVCVSIASSDSSPRSVWEAVASGTPCVVSDLPWVHELIERRAATPSSCRSTLSRSRRRSGPILDDPALAQALARNGRQLVEAHHDQTRRDGPRRGQLPAVLAPARSA